MLGRLYMSKMNPAACDCHAAVEAVHSQGNAASVLTMQQCAAHVCLLAANGHC